MNFGTLKGFLVFFFLKDALLRFSVVFKLLSLEMNGISQYPCLSGCDPAWFGQLPSISLSVWCHQKYDKSSSWRDDSAVTESDALEDQRPVPPHPRMLGGVTAYNFSFSSLFWLL